MPDVLLSRYAECLFWLARCIERTENLARILDVNETFSRDSRGGQNWLSVLQLYGDEARFKEMHGEATARSVLRFYVTDAGNPTSIVFAVRFVRENARALRPLISIQMWTQINVLHNRLGRRRAVRLREAVLVGVELQHGQPVPAAAAVPREGRVDVEDAGEVLRPLDVAGEPEDRFRVAGEQGGISQGPRYPSIRRPAMS